MTVKASVFESWCWQMFGVQTKQISFRDVPPQEKTNGYHLWVEWGCRSHPGSGWIHCCLLEDFQDREAARIWRTYRYFHSRPRDHSHVSLSSAESLEKKANSHGHSDCMTIKSPEMAVFKSLTTSVPSWNPHKDGWRELTPWLSSDLRTH